MRPQSLRMDERNHIEKSLFEQVGRSDERSVIRRARRCRLTPAAKPTYQTVSACSAAAVILEPGRFALLPQIDQPLGDERRHPVARAPKPLTDSGEDG